MTPVEAQIIVQMDSRLEFPFSFESESPLFEFTLLKLELTGCCERRIDGYGCVPNVRE